MYGKPAIDVSDLSRDLDWKSADIRPPSTLNEEWALRYINFLEREEPVGQAVLGGLHFWPWIRIRIFQQLLAPALGMATYEYRQTGWQKVKSAIRKLSGQARADRKRLRDQSRLLRDADFLFYSCIPNYQVDHAGLDYDRVLDPICALIGAGMTWRKFHVGGGPSVQARAQAVPGIALSSDAERHLPLSPGPPADIRHATRWMAALESRLFEETGRRVELSEHVLWTVAMVRRYRLFFRIVLDGAQVKAVLMPCYYGERQAGLIWACRDLGIATVDLQHGKQGILSMGYGKWPTVPDCGYETMPDMFWVWGRESAANLRIGAPGQPGMPKIQVTGNPYVGQWVDGAPINYRGTAPEFWNRVDAAGRVILVTLQPFSLDKALPPDLVGAMRNSPADWLWLLRMHPARRPSGDEIEGRLRANDVPAERYEIWESSRHPLYALLKHTDVHVTLWSSCGYEALCFGVPTIFLDDFARTLYEGYLEQGLFHSASNAVEILERVGSAGQNWDVREQCPYIETDPALTRRALAGLAANHQVSRSANR